MQTTTNTTETKPVKIAMTKTQIAAAVTVNGNKIKINGHKLTLVSAPSISVSKATFRPEFTFRFDLSRADAFDIGLGYSNLCLVVCGSDEEPSLRIDYAEHLTLYRLAEVFEDPCNLKLKTWMFRQAKRMKCNTFESTYSLNGDAIGYGVKLAEVVLKHHDKKSRRKSLNILAGLNVLADDFLVRKYCITEVLPEKYNSICAISDSGFRRLAQAAFLELMNRYMEAEQAEAA